MNKVYIIMYHYVRDLEHSRYPEIKGLTTDKFKKQVDFLKDNFNPIRMEDLLESLESGRKLPERAVLLTFDDGYIDHYNAVFPILKNAGMQGSFFIPGEAFREHKLLTVNKIHFILASGQIRDIREDVIELMDSERRNGSAFEDTDALIEKWQKAGRYDIPETVFVKKMLQTVLPEEVRERISSELFRKYVGMSETEMAYELYLNEDQARLMKRDGMFIGAHGYRHYWLGDLPEEDMKRDVDLGLDCISEFMEMDNWVMNYPYGSQNQGVVDYVKSRGCKAGIATTVGVADVEKDDRYLLSRLNTNDFPPVSDKYTEF